MHWLACESTPTRGCSPNSHTHSARWSARHGRASAGHAASGNAAMDATASGGGAWTSAPRDGWDAASRSCVCGCRVRVLDAVLLECAWWEGECMCSLSRGVCASVPGMHRPAREWTHARMLTKRTRASDQVVRLALSEDRPDRPDRRRRVQWGHRHRAGPLGWQRLALRCRGALRRRPAGHPLGWRRLALRRSSRRRRHRTRACDSAGGSSTAPFWPALMLRILP